MNSNEMIALDVLNEMLRLYPSAFTALKEYSWLSDTISADEFEGILGLLVIVDRFPTGDPSLLQALSETPWLQEGIGPSEAEFLNSVARNMEKPANKIDSLRNPALREIPSCTPPPGPTLGPLVAVADLPWTRDGLPELEQKALSDLQTFEREYPDMAEFVLSYPWVADGITEDEQLALHYLLVITQGGPWQNSLTARCQTINTARRS